MSEQYPLLCEEASNEDRTKYRRRHCPRTIRGRAKYHLKGAAVIMSRWPDHWRSSLTYWWIGIGMISLSTFVIYNTVVLTGIFQQTTALDYPATPFFQLSTSRPYPSVNMHLFVNDQIDVNKYIPHIEIFANKYENFKYNLFIVTNDTNGETSNFTDEINNDVALNSLWDNDIHHYANAIPSKGSSKNIYVNYVTLSQLLDNSPLLHQWKNLPHQFIPFLVRVVSIWNKGGIAVNPDIFLSHSPHAAYVNKFDSIIKNFKKTKGKVLPDLEKPKIPNKHKHLPKVNNIRDIINALETRNTTGSSDEETFYAAESRNNSVLSNSENKMKYIQKDLIADTKTIELNKTTHKETSNDTNQPNLGNKIELLPQFRDFLFHNNKLNKTKATTTLLEEPKSSNHQLETTNAKNENKVRHFRKEIQSADDYWPMIVSAKGITSNYITNNDKATHQDDQLFELTVDLKGNIIATGTPCHAFIGNLFVNVIHHGKAESITDFIIKELSIFCKGLLTSCVGIDVILI